jgi:hypothetical protein
MVSDNAFFFLTYYTIVSFGVRDRTKEERGTIPLPVFNGCRKRLLTALTYETTGLTALTYEIDCGQTAMGLPHVTYAVFIIVKSFL